MGSDLSGATLLITGGTGSFGNAVLGRFLQSDVAEIRIFSRDEKKQNDMRLSYRNDKLKFYIGDVRDYRSVLNATEGADFVFHAAALKQVPSCEFYPIEAVKTNVLGTENVLEAAITAGAKRVVVLSTDKAVYPINAMGMTKALMEKVAVASSRNVDPEKTCICITRYGNVMASRGSVIPLFIDQIQSGKAMTVTDPTMTRFLMHLSEAVDLVMHGFISGEQGDLFVRKSPAATIGDLATALMELYSVDRDIVTIGTRHGEKLYETLVNREEMIRAEESDEYYRIPADTRDLNYSQYFESGDKHISTVDEYTSHNTRRLTVDEVKDLLLSLDVIREAIHA